MLASMASTTGRRDEVDRLVAAWPRERPDLDVAPLEVLSRVSRLARHLDRARRQAFGEHEPGDVGVRRAVVAATGRRAVRAVTRAAADATLVTSGTMTNRIDRLAARGSGRRAVRTRTTAAGVLVTLTDDGRARVDAALADLLAQERAILSALPRSDQERLADLLREVTVPFDDANTDTDP